MTEATATRRCKGLPRKHYNSQQHDEEQPEQPPETQHELEQPEQQQEANTQLPPTNSSPVVTNDSYTINITDPTTDLVATSSSGYGNTTGAGATDNFKVIKPLISFPSSFVLFALLVLYVVLLIWTV